MSLADWLRSASPPPPDAPPAPRRDATGRRRRNWVLLVIATLVGGSAIRAFIPECGTVWRVGDTDITSLVASGVCDPTWVYLATLIVALVAVAAEIVLGSRGDTGRPCPACNTQVPTGRTRCEACGYDFAAAP